MCFCSGVIVEKDFVDLFVFDVKGDVFIIKKFFKIKKGFKLDEIFVVWLVVLVVFMCKCFVYDKIIDGVFLVKR